MRIPYFQVAAFTAKSFGGNPAGVCVLDSWPADHTLQSIAAENNLSETAFFVRAGEEFDLRWFTPAVEVDLCGHATLASAFVLFSELDYSRDIITFQSRSGPLRASRQGERIELDFPARPAVACAVPELLLSGLGKPPVEVLKARDYLAVYNSQGEVAGLDPDMRMLGQLDCLGIIVTALGQDADFVSRFFAPAAGIPEDPVTGSAHCTLIPYWSARLGKTKMFARQLSRRGGELFCELAGDRVLIGGKAVLYSRGQIEIENAST